MTKKEKASAVRRKRAPQNKKGRGGKKSVVVKVKAHPCKYKG